MSGPKHTPTVLYGPCPGCNGEPYEEHWDAPYACPDCAGTGKAENSITANEKLREAAPRLAEALVECVPWIEIDARSQRQVGNLGAAERLEGVAERARAALREAGINEERNK